MVENKKLVGRGLKDLIDEHNVNKILDNEIIVEISLKDIITNENQPRKFFDPILIEELAKSIKEHGVFQPIIVRKEEGKYLIVSGERRFHATTLAGLKTIPAVIRSYSDSKIAEISLVENLQRENLSSIEEAKAFDIIIKANNLSHEEFSKTIGKSRSYVTNILGLLKLPEVVQELVMKKELSMGHARVLSKMDNELEVIELANRIINEKLSVRDIESGKYKNLSKNANKINYNRVYKEERSVLRKYYNSKVSITENKIVFKVNNEEEVKEIMEMLLKNAL